MYISIMAGTPGSSDFLQDVGRGPIESGSVALEWDEEAEDPEDNRILGQLAAYLKLPWWAEARLLEINPDQRTAFERSKGWIAIHYAQWYVTDVGPMGVATTRNIFMVGDDGKTIGKVR